MKDISFSRDTQGEIIKETQRFGYLPQELPDREKKKTVLEFCEEFYDITLKRLEEISRELGSYQGFSIQIKW